MTESTSVTPAGWRMRIWQSVARIPLWAFVVLAILLVCAAIAWGLLGPIIRERRAILRLESYPHVHVMGGNFTIDDPFEGYVTSSAQRRWWDQVVARLTGDGTWSPEPISVFLGSETPLAALRDLQAIRSLRLVSLGGAQWTDKELATLATRFCLTDLYLTETSITPAGWRALERLPLNTLAVTSQALGPEFFRVVRNLPALDTLVLSDCEISVADLKLLEGHPTLVGVSIMESGMTSDCIEVLATIPDLTVLDLSRTAVDDSILSELGRLKSLHTLTLDGTRVTDAGLAAIPASVRLDSLSLAMTRISAAGLMSLKQVPANLSLTGTEVRVTEPLQRWFLAHSFEEVTLDESMIDPRSSAVAELKAHITQLYLEPPSSPANASGE